jgi:hypothetical protein
VQPQARQDLTYFVAGPALATLGVAGLFSLHPWPTLPGSGQAQALGWLPTLAFLAVGAVGVFLSSRIGCPPAPPLTDRAGWRRVLVWGLGAGFLLGLYDAIIGALTHVRSEAIDRAHGFTWANVALPWSLAHYFHAAVTLECAFRLGIVVIPAWIVGRLILKGRAEAPVFWVFAVLAAWIEPLMHALYAKKLLFADMAPLDIALNLSSMDASALRVGGADPGALRVVSHRPSVRRLPLSAHRRNVPGAALT